MAKRTVFLSSLKYIVPEQFEHFLEMMARQGWHPDPLTDSSGAVMNLHRDSPGEYRYVVDSPPVIGSDYYKHYQRYGWEHMGNIGDLVFWRAGHDGKVRPDSFVSPKDIDRHNTAIYRNLSVGFMFGMAAMLLTTMMVWRLPGGTSIWTGLLILGGDLIILCLMAYLRRIQRRMELGDRARATPPDEMNRYI